MAKHNDLGKAGENAAAAYLEQKDYLIRHRNWRKGHFELDIVAAKDNELIVVEVKTRSNTEFLLNRKMLWMYRNKTYSTCCGYVHKAISD